MWARSISYTMVVSSWFLVAPAAAAPDSELIDPRWTQHDPASAGEVDHSAWGAFLDRYVERAESGVNLVAYGRVTSEDRRALDAYIARLEATPVSTLNRDEQFAFWVNLYNARTVDLVVEAYPVDSIREIMGGLFNTGPWDEEVVTVEGHDLSLNDIEHGILRPIWEDPRIHYAVNCASIGCPNLAPEPWTAARLEDMLDGAARAYVNHPRGAEVTQDGLVVSSIYTWYMEDFGGTDAGVIDHLRRYAEPELRVRLDGITSIADDRYDWSLNEAR